MLLSWTSRCGAERAAQPPNIIMLLADDLGYGDLSVAPFVSPVMNGIKTPALEEMARNGMKMTNFHVASPVCSPSRASIMSGLFSWRLGVDFIYAGDLKNDGTEEIDHEYLPMMPNIASSLRGAGYYTAHIGKWHLGGQSQNEIPTRYAGRGKMLHVPFPESTNMVLTTMLACPRHRQ